MKILVLVKQVPDPNALRLDSSGNFAANTARVVNEYDQYALEAAVQIKEQSADTEVTVVSIGPAGAKDTVSRGLAMGADKGILVQGEPGGLDSLQTSQVLAGIAREDNYDLVLVGQESSDSGSGNVGPQIAGLLGLPLISNVVELEVNGSSLNLQREVEDGRHVVSVEMPAVVCALTGLNDPRSPSLKGIMAARRKPIEERALAPEQSATVTWGNFREEARAVEGVVIEDAPDVAAKRVVALLKERNAL